MLVTRHVTLTFTNAVGTSLAMNFHGTFIPQVLDEDRAQNIHRVEQGGVEGSIVMGDRPGDLYMELRGQVRRPNMTTEQAVRQLGHVFNQTLPGVMRYRNDNPHISIPTKEIPYRLEKNPKIYWDHNQKILRFIISMVAPSSFYQGVAHTEVIAETKKLFRFPHSSPQRRVLRPERPAGFIFASRAEALQSTFNNIGDVRSGFTATLRARGGTVVNPSIINVTTGERIRLLVTMAPHDIITIISTPQERRVFHNGARAMNRVDAPNTNFFLLGVGENQIGFDADVNVGNMAVYIQYVPLFTFAESGHNA